MTLLKTEQLDHFNKHGYLVVKNAIYEKLLANVKTEYANKLNDLVKVWVAEGKMDESVIGQSFTEQLLASYAANCDYFQPLDISLPFDGITADMPMHCGEAIFNIMVSDSILDIAESIIGPEINSNPIQHVRIKPPSRVLYGDEHRSHITNTQWHQDRGVAQEKADKTSMVTIWLAITDATKENGCLQVISDTQKGDLITHCPMDQLGIPDKLVDEAKATPLEVNAGDAIIFHPLTIHGAGMNNSESFRWSFDLRYTKIGQETGRDHFPHFVARSRANPASELRDHKEWEKMWEETKFKIAGVSDLNYNRWNASAPACA